MQINEKNIVNKTENIKSKEKQINKLRIIKKIKKNISLLNFFCVNKNHSIDNKNETKIIKIFK